MPRHPPAALNSLTKRISGKLSISTLTAFTDPQAPFISSELLLLLRLIFLKFNAKVPRRRGAKREKTYLNWTLTSQTNYFTPFAPLRLFYLCVEFSFTCIH